MRTALLMVLTCWPLLGLSGEEILPNYIEVQGPTISPDGKSVVFNVAHRTDAKGVIGGAVTLLDLDKGTTRKLLKGRLGRPVKLADSNSSRLPVRYAEAWYGFSWSPNGEAVFAAVIENKGFTVWKIPVGSENARRICSLPEGLCQRPRACPDGSYVMFRDAITHDLFRIAPGGGTLTRLTKTGDVHPLGYDWAPDGKHIYCSRGYMREDKVCGIWRMNADGTGAELLLDNHYGRSMAVSPFGKHIAFTEETYDPGNKLLIYRLGDNKPVLLADKANLYLSWHPRSDVLFYTDDKGLHEWRASTGSSRLLLSCEKCYFPAARPDGEQVLFLKKEQKSTCLWRLDVASGKTEQLYPKP